MKQRGSNVYETIHHKCIDHTLTKIISFRREVSWRMSNPAQNTSVFVSWRFLWIGETNIDAMPPSSQDERWHWDWYVGRWWYFYHNKNGPHSIGYISFYLVRVWKLLAVRNMESFVSPTSTWTKELLRWNGLYFFLLANCYMSHSYWIDAVIFVVISVLLLLYEVVAEWYKRITVLKRTNQSF